MKIVYLLLLSLSLFNCNSQSNPKITYKNYVNEFQADDYPKSITDYYKNENKLYNLNDREIAIKMNASIILEDLIDNLLRYSFLENVEKLSESHFNSVKSKLTKYYEEEKIDYYSDKIIIDRAQQWIADSIVQSKYGGEIYYDSLRKIPKPREAYKRIVLDLINKNEIRISDEFLESEIINLVNDYTKHHEEFKGNFNMIESWNKKK